MASGALENKKESSGGRSAQREQTRARILQAVLDIMVEHGSRGVRHRAVARRAGVSLGSTTYHFSSIEDLIISAFDYWRIQKMMRVNPYYLEVQQRLKPFVGGVVPLDLRPQMAAWICNQSVGYVCDQVDEKHRYDRLVELSFYHESIRYPSLRKLLINIREVELEYLTQVHRVMGSAQPSEDARITVALFRQLEQSVVMAVLPGLTTSVIRQTIHRHLSMCLGIPVPLEAESAV